MVAQAPPVAAAEAEEVLREEWAQQQVGWSGSQRAPRGSTPTRPVWGCQDGLPISPAFPGVVTGGVFVGRHLFWAFWGFCPIEDLLFTTRTVYRECLGC